MSNESAESLAFWPCPIIVNPAERIGKNNKPLRHPAFPWIDLSLEGFTVSHLHWVGINVTKPIQRKPLIQLALLHELCHKELAFRPFSLFVKDLIAELYCLVIETFDEGRERIAVPLSADQSGNAGNELRELWKEAIAFKQSSSLVEEIYAIRSSLLAAKDKGIIEDDKLLNYILTHYKKEYGKRIPYFQEFYDKFDFTVEKIGETAAKALIYYALGTGDPNLAFARIITEMCKTKGSSQQAAMNPPTDIESHLWFLPDESTDFLVNSSIERAIGFFTGFMDGFDPGDSLDRKGLSDYIGRIKQRWRDMPKEDYTEVVKLLFNPSPTTFLYSEYNDTMHISIELKGSEEIERESGVIVLESIMHQITTGKGLLCPFWVESSHSCCYDGFREKLEQIWSCTSHNRSCNWRRMGCLDKDSGQY